MKEHNDDDVRRVITDLDQMRLGPAGSGTGYVLPPDMSTLMGNCWCRLGV